MRTYKIDRFGVAVYIDGYSFSQRAQKPDEKLDSRD